MSSHPTLAVGPVLIGVLLSYFLYGVYIANLFRYISKQPTKGGPVTVYSRVALTLITIVEAISIGFITNGIWRNLVGGINDPSKRDRLSYTNVWVPIFHGSVAMMVQIFFAQKIYILGKHSVAKGLAVFIGLLSTLQFSAGICIPILFLKTRKTIIIPPVSPLEISAAIHLSSMLACDVIITACMVIILARFKRQTAFSATKRMLNTLTIHTIENGLVTTVLALINIVLYFTQKHENTIHIMIYYILPRIYAIVMVISLNHSSTADPEGISTSDLFPPPSIIDLPKHHSPPTSPLELKLRLKRSNGNS